MGREDTPRRLWRRDGFISCPGLCPAEAVPRSAGLSPLAPEPRHGGEHRVIPFDDRSYPDWKAIVLPLSVDRAAVAYYLLDLKIYCFYIIPIVE